VTIKLNYPEYVLLLINEESQQIAVQVCDADDENAVAFYHQKASGILSVRWNSRDLLNTLENLTGWDLSQQSFKVFGTLLKSENAMVFDLTHAQELK
jgi:hypothetical protein